MLPSFLFQTTLHFCPNSVVIPVLTLFSFLSILLSTLSVLTLSLPPSLPCTHPNPCTRLSLCLPCFFSSILNSPPVPFLSLCLFSYQPCSYQPSKYSSPVFIPINVPLVSYSYYRAPTSATALFSSLSSLCSSPILITVLLRVLVFFPQLFSFNKMQKKYITLFSLFAT